LEESSESAEVEDLAPGSEDGKDDAVGAGRAAACREREVTGAIEPRKDR
jgi:hypothetical protein